MQRAKKEKTIWLVVGILTSVFGISAIPCIILSALAGEYFWMAVAIAFTAHGFYGVTFYFLAFARAGERLRCVKAFDEGLRSYDKIGDYLLLNEQSTRKILAECLKKEFITGYYLGDEGLVEIESEAEKGEEIICSNCGSRLKVDERECPCCGARPEALNQ